MLSPSPTLIETPAALAFFVDRAMRSPLVAVDVEANGRFAFRARLSTLQMATVDEIVVVDPLAPDIARRLAPLVPLFVSDRPVKILHDVGFDARLLAAEGLRLGGVHDTALAASWLGRSATGLASLVAAELGVVLDKSLQSYDWASRPLTERCIGYLTGDVRHLGALRDRLWAEVVAAGIEEEVLEETRYRLETAVEAVLSPDPRPPFARLKGLHRVSPSDRPVVRRLAMAREAEAERLDVPAAELVRNDVLLAIGRARPRSKAGLAKVAWPIASVHDDGVAEALLQAVGQGLADGPLSPEDAAWFEPARLPRGEANTRKGREIRVSAWRRGEAEARKVHEQVVLPGHCASDLVAASVSNLDDLAGIRGLGPFRIARYGAALLEALRGSEP